MAGLPLPNDNRVGPGLPFFGEVWAKFFAAISRKFNAGAAISVVSTADAIDPTTTQALVNELKAKVNAMIEAQKA
jgi:hypothetical protein